MNIWRCRPTLTALFRPARTDRCAIFGESPDAATLRQWALIDDLVNAGAAATTAR
jgi:hypothetical protein